MPSFAPVLRSIPFPTLFVIEPALTRLRSIVSLVWPPRRKIPAPPLLRIVFPVKLLLTFVLSGKPMKTPSIWLASMMLSWNVPLFPEPNSPQRLPLRTLLFTVRLLALKPIPPSTL